MSKSLQEIPIECLQRGRYQPRRQFREDELQELADSISSAGLIQPLIVRPLNNGSYEIVAGERRWRAAQRAGLQSVFCLVNRYSDEQTAAISTIENINRVDLNPIEEAKAFQRLITEFGYLHEELAAIVGKSRAKISNSIRLLKCDEKVQAFLSSGKLSEGHGKILAGLPAHKQIELAEKCVSQGWSVRHVEKEIKKLINQPREKKQLDPDITALENAIGDQIGCRVKIDYDNHNCQLHIDCHNLEILEGILEKIGLKTKIE